ncbi:MAG: SiaB family protein kinase [Reichenbachiella sp.]
MAQLRRQKTKQYNMLNHLKNIVTFRELMEDSDVNIVYLGKVTQSTIDGITDMMEDDMKDRKESKSVSKRVYHVMIEALQNICKHADSTADYASNSLEQGLAKDGIFLIGNNDDEYYVTTGNQIDLDQAVLLRDTLDHINALDKEGLRELHKEKMASGEISDVGGAGLGFIDIKKRTGTEYEYYFEPISEKHCFFILTIRILKESVKEF